MAPGRLAGKYERLADAFARVAKTEIGLEASVGDARFIGVYEHPYDTNVFGEEGFATHAVVLAYELNLNHRELFITASQRLARGQ